MRVIYKYQLDVIDRQDIQLHQDCDILSVQLQDGVPCMWVMIDQSQPVMRVTIRCLGTGHNNYENHQFLKYIATIQMPSAAVWHWFLELPV